MQEASRLSPPSCEMPSSPDHQHHVRRIVLPSGKTIEVVYFQDVDVPSEAITGGAVPTDLHRCDGCASELVYPVDWEEAGSEHWEVQLRCPNCEWRGAGLYTQEAVERFDELLDLGTEAVVRDLTRIMQANMESEIVRFAGALTDGLIVPDDF